jgi:phenylacetate-CoA ligase
VNPLTFLRMAARMRLMQQRDRWTRERLEAHRRSELARLRGHAYARSPFYRRFHRGLLDAPLSELPVLRKATLMEHFDELVADRAIRLADARQHLATLSGDEQFLGTYRLTATSGTTGQPGIFLHDHDEWLWIITSFARCQQLAGGQIRLTHRSRLGVVASTVPWHVSSRVGDSVRSWWTPEIRFMISEPLDRIVEVFNRWQPEVLVAYPSIANALAAEQQAGRLRISPIRIHTGAGLLTPEWRARIEETWGRRLFDQYGATEAGIIAAECEQHSGLHLMDDLLITEVVDRDDRPVPDGELGARVLVTVLNSRTLPLIRYEISDCVAVAPGPCACGRPSRRLGSVQGKIEELIALPGRVGGTVGVRPMPLIGVMDQVPVRSWQLQADQGILTLRVVGLADDYAPATIQRRFNEVFASQGAVDTPLAIVPVDDIPLGASGKPVQIVIKKAHRPEP